MREEPAPVAEGAEAVPEKKKRGKPKDEHAPPKPKNPYSRFAGECRTKLKETRPELVSDLSAMGKAIAEEWAKVPEAWKEKTQVEYDAEMVVWKPLWAAYKITTNYKEFVEVKTDYLDKRAQKKLVKVMNKEAPKKPRSGYMIFAGTVREGVMEKVRADNLGLAAAGAMIAAKWAELTEGQKGEFGEQALRQKIEYDKLFGVYKQTEAFGTFCDAKAKLEGTQQLKKIVRTHLDEAPKKPPSGYSLFRAEVMPGICEENAKKKEGEGKLSMGDMGKKISGMWMEVPAERKAELAAIAEKAKEQYAIEFKQFKSHQKYTAFLEKRQKIKARENLLVHLRELPKRPKSVFAMFSADHKDEVPKGKGEGKGTHALRTKFAETPKEELKNYEAKNEELTDQWKEDTKVFKEGPKYKTFETTKQKIILEFKNEAIKVTTLKFLAAAPPSPPKTAFAIYVGEKRKAAGEPEGAKKSKEAKREEVVKAKEEWMKLDKVVRDGYEGKRKDVLKAYEEEVKGFMAGDKWQDYQKEAKRLRIPIKSLLYHKKNIIKKTKDGKVSPASVPIPEKPDLFPLKPLGAIQIFMAEKKKTVDSVAEIHDMWKNLSPENKAPYDEQAAEQVKKHAADMQEFRRSDEGKKYVRDLAGAQRRRRMISARNNYLDDYPKKPTSAIYDWMRANMKKVRKEMPEGSKGFEIKNKLTEKWNALSEEDKAPLEKAAADKMEAYNQKMTDFKASDNWKKYLSATKAGFGKAKGKAKGGPGAPKVPDSMPKKPFNAFQAYLSEMSKADKGEAAKNFGSLPQEDKQRYLQEAKERDSQFQDDLVAFNSSPAGRKYRLANAAFIKRKRLTSLKAQFLKDEPVRPKGAQMLYFAGNRSKVMEENPELKGLGPVQIKLAADWKALSGEDRQEWVDKAKAEAEEHMQKLTEFQATENYKKYKRLSAAVLGMGRAKGKGKAQAAPAGVVPMPPKPEGCPKAPTNGMFMFGDATRAGGGPRGLPEINKLWKEQGEAGQKEWNEKATEARKKYEEDMREFQKSAEGKKYLRLKMVAEKKNRLVAAKKKFLGAPGAPQEPKRPASSYFIFLGQESGSITDKSRADKAKELTVKWNALTPEEKAVFEDKAKALKAKYDEDMQAYRNSNGYKAYEKTLRVVTGSGARAVAAKKAKVVTAGRGRAAPAAKTAPAPKAAKTTDGDSDDQMGSDSSSKSSKSSKSSSSSNSD